MQLEISIILNVFTRGIYNKTDLLKNRKLERFARRYIYSSASFFVNTLNSSIFLGYLFMAQPIGIVHDYSIIHISPMNRHVIQNWIGALDTATLISRIESCGKNLLPNVDKDFSKN